ncbi:hypothetical protein F2Q70_00020195 [Brassica cretica]|uniref:Uncharacterized protein n=1 Tax=Brassica cretica TaxID=69181 RepID=A0A8S9GQL9_BRACR|nr:hypothetical protein F2Q70_00020195 [Brassica cretica]
MCPPTEHVASSTSQEQTVNQEEDKEDATTNPQEFRASSPSETPSMPTMRSPVGSKHRHTKSNPLSSSSSGLTPEKHSRGFSSGEIFRSVGQTFDLESPIQHFDDFRDYSFGIINQTINGVAAVLDVGNKIGQAGVDFGSGLNVMVQQFFRRLPILFLNDDSKLIGKSLRSHRAYVDTKDDLGLAAERLIDSGFSKTDDSVTLSEEEVADSYLRTGGFLGRSKGKIDISSSYDSRINGLFKRFVLCFCFFLLCFEGLGGLGFR